MLKCETLAFYWTETASVSQIERYQDGFYHTHYHAQLYFCRNR
jgi:hypothetical protein